MKNNYLNGKTKRGMTSYSECHSSLILVISLIRCVILKTSLISWYGYEFFIIEHN